MYMSNQEQPWQESMPQEQFELMREILAAPSPVGLEGAMTYGVLKPEFEDFMPDDWEIHQFRGNAGLILDSAPDDDEALTVMVIGHADKIRMQVRSIGDDGKIWINSDSFLPTTLLGNEVTIFSEDPDEPGEYRQLKGGTVEALGAIHFADAALRKGKKGVKKDQLYVELHIHGDDKKEQIEDLGIRPGDSILLDRPIRHGFGDDTFTGAYLDNGLGCFVTTEIARLIADEGGLDNVRCLFTIAAYEEIGRFGSRVVAGEFQPDVVVGVDVNHDYVAAPGVSDKRFTPLEMGEGCTMSVGSIASEYLNKIIETTAHDHDIPLQRDVCGRDTGTDAMAAVLASIDAAATSIGFPIRNMHTISEAGHTGDVLAAIHALTKSIQSMDEMNDGDGLSSEDFEDGHPRLDQSEDLS